jgi:hypothetical protein
MIEKNFTNFKKSDKPSSQSIKQDEEEDSEPVPIKFKGLKDRSG